MREVDLEREGITNADRRKRRTHFPHRVSSSFTCFQWP